MLYLLGVLALIFGLIVSVALHEFGHLIPAKRFGVLVPQYMVGFGPTLFSRRVGGTEYGIKAILLGGYVRILGMYPKPRDNTPRFRIDGHGRALTLAQAQTSGVDSQRWHPTLAEIARQSATDEIPPDATGQPYYLLNPVRKIVIMLGGPVMNLLLSVVLLLVSICFIGYSAPTLTLAEVQGCTATDYGSDPDGCELRYPARAAGLQPGQTISEVAGVPVDDWEAFREQLARHRGDTVSITTVSVSGNSQHQVAIPADGSAIGVVARTQQQRGTFADVVADVRYIFIGTLQVVVRLPIAVWDTAASMFTGSQRNADVISVVGVGRMAGEISDSGQISAADRVSSLLSLLASLNMALFVFNLIPLPPLDGGHIVGSLWQIIRDGSRRLRGLNKLGAPDTARAMALTYSVVALLIIMTVILVIADIVKPVPLG
ncbi:MAG: site-2 protease family protein [Varibaculum sp.]|nr:site-2 protease family protein [Varibaculum sp.]